MRIDDLLVEQSQNVAFTYGRFNPPTIAHGQAVFGKLASVGEDYFIFSSQTQNAKKDPLDWKTKIYFMQQLFPAHAQHVVDDPSVTNIMKAVMWIWNQGYTHQLTMVIGGDRESEGFGAVVQKYNGVDSTHGQYAFSEIIVVNAGARDDEAEGLSGVSASKAREAAVNGDYETFASMMPNVQAVDNLYQAVRKGMGVL